MEPPKQIEVIARAVASRHGRVLLCRNRKNGYAFLPGGHVEPGEPAVEALRREFLEETGLQVAVGRFLLANESTFIQGGKARHEVNLVFHVEHDDGHWPERVPSLEERISFEWVEPVALPEARFLPPAILAWLLAGGAGGGLEPWLTHHERPT